MQLLLIRHGDAVSEQIDPRRPLSQTGEKEVDTLAQFIKSTNLHCKDIYHSSKLRAGQTARIIQKQAIPDARLIEKPYLSPNDSIDDVFEDIQKANNNIMIVGHLPFLPYLIYELLKTDASRNFIAIPTATLIVMENNRDGNWYITNMINPGILLNQNQIPGG